MDRIGQGWPKIASGAAILAVASVAGIISYSHIYDLTLSLHQSALTARLMPVAIDGLITMGSVVLLQSGSRLGWLGVGPGLALSVFANIESGIRYGWLSATWAGIPAVSFFLACFILEHWLKAQARPQAVLAGESETVPAVPESEPVPVTTEPGTGTAPSTQPTAPESAPRAAGRAQKKPAVRTIRTPVPADLYAADLAAGRLPSIRQVKNDLKVGQPRAKAIRGELEAAMAAGAAVAA